MSYTLELHYSVSNGGDGSAYPRFCLSEEIAQLHQDIQNELGEGWGEDCMGSITLVSESPIRVEGDRMITKESLLESLEYYLEGGYHKDKAVKKTAEEIRDRVLAL